MSDEWQVRIVVLDRGFVKICQTPDPHGCAIWLPYRNGRTVRRWGTTAGLAELISGPLAETVLDAPVAAGVLPVRAIIDIMDAEAAAWLSHLIPQSSAGATRPSASSSSRTTRRSEATR